MSQTTKEPRDINKVMDAISEHLSLEGKAELRYESQFWAPENAWAGLSCIIHRRIVRDSSDPKAVAIYALLCDKTEEEIKYAFDVSDAAGH